MARGRMIAATVADDKRFNELPVDAALVYLMAIPQLDRDGLILGEPGPLWGMVCRRRNDLVARMEAIIAAWLASGLVTAYKNEDGDTVLHFVGFQKNQAMTHYDREAASRFPCPPGYARTPKGLVQDEVKQPVQDAIEQVRIDSGPQPDEILPNVIQSKPMQSKGGVGGGNNGFGSDRRVNAASQTTEAAKLGVNAETFRLMTDALIDAAGWRALVDDLEDDSKLNTAKENALALVRLGNTTMEQVSNLVAAYKARNTWRDSLPQPKDIVTYASQAKQGLDTKPKNGKISDSDRHVANAWEVLMQQSAETQQ
jgi:hypothetical protein